MANQHPENVGEFEMRRELIIDLLRRVYPEANISELEGLTDKELLEIVECIPIFYPDTPPGKRLIKCLSKETVKGILTAAHPIVLKKIVQEGVVKEGLKKIVKEGVREVVEEGSIKIVREGGKALVQGSWKKILTEGGKEVLEEGLETIVREGGREVVEEGLKKIVREGGKEVAEESLKKFVREGGKEVVEVGFKKIVREGGKEVAEEGLKKVAKEGGKKGAEGAAKSGVKCALMVGVLVEGISLGASIYCAKKKLEKCEITQNQFNQHVVKRSSAAVGM